MDSSAIRDCEEIEHALGGASAVAHLTGSRAFPRFTGPQIRKFARERPAAYEQTERIHLVSSYMASVLTGQHAGVDHADASGMNLMDIRLRQWSRRAAAATAPDVLTKLPTLVPADRIVGTLAAGSQARYGLPAIPVIAWSGDNPCSLVGTGLLREGQLAISLGTSDTIFGPMNEPRVSQGGTGHVFASPLGTYMGITVFRNGSLARERVRTQFGLTWDGFSEALRATPPGNNGAMMLPWFEPEITPPVARGATRQFDLGTAAAPHVRAIVEAQAMALARHSEWMGVVPRTIYATGGAAANREILKVIADVFDAEVYQFETTASAALGAALRAYQAHTCRTWEEAITGFVSPVVSSRVVPTPGSVEIYRQLRPVYAAREQEALSDRR
jgi:xylulokinase